MKKGILLGILGCTLVAGWIAPSANAARNRGAGNPQPIPVLNQDETDDLLFMREEEKLAHDVYVTMYGEWWLQVFDNISQSEQRHTDAVLGLLEKYSVDDPALSEIGKFANADLQDLYDGLIDSGYESELNALYVGALIEEVDMDDIVAAMQRTDKKDILSVYENLLAGSENHLRAFVRNIEGMTGEMYVAQYLTQEEVDAILGR